MSEEEEDWIDFEGLDDGVDEEDNDGASQLSNSVEDLSLSDRSSLKFLKDNGI